ncbi:MAG: DUF2207 domain-containing protein [Pseudolysinimonas sp.]|uniref:DUF2207 domain-containing protein n=1 Tax=Pseudolysinimonas sp. TaxID=2680009 RepID=UPI003267CC94
MRAPKITRALAVLAGVFALSALGAAPALADEAPSASGASGASSVASCASSPTASQFEFQSFDGKYELGRDSGGRSTLHATETLVATFPATNQNRGIRRDLVTSYDGHDTGLKVVGVTVNGTPASYDSSKSTDSNDQAVLSLTIALPCGQYQHGDTTYVIEYTQQDVTHKPNNLDADEFYWDINGDGWGQPFEEVSATVELAPELNGSLNAGITPSCYLGRAGSTDQCSIRADGSTFKATATNVLSYQNMTIAIDFTKGTFAGPPWWAIVPIIPLLPLFLTALQLIAAILIRVVFWRNAAGRGIVVAEYTPPEGVSALIAANLVGRASKGMAASVVDLAVRKKLKILEHDAGWSKVFGVQYIDNAGLDPDEQRVMGALFSVNPFSMGSFLPGLRTIFQMSGQSAQPMPTSDGGGEVRWLTKGDTILGQQVVALTKAVAREVEAGGLRRKPSPWPITLVVLMGVLAGIIALGSTIFGGDSGTSVALGVVSLNVIPWVTIICAGLLGGRRPLTPKGAELKEHLDGLKEYIRLAEADRLQMLQSVSGADRITTSDGNQIVKIYERLLPYAVLFGLEKQWAVEIAKYYDTTPPDWYSGTSGFQAGAFAAGIGSLSSSVSTSFSGSSSGSGSGSSSSGGGGGGGSSGGGGGGGGGGGV